MGAASDLLLAAGVSCFGAGASSPKSMRLPSAVPEEVGRLIDSDVEVLGGITCF